MNPDTILQAPAIEFRNVFLRFDDHVVLNDISFTLDRGEMILLTGVSGSGKSVLLRLAMGLLKPDSGQIFVEGRGDRQSERIGTPRHTRGVDGHGLSGRFTLHGSSRL